MSKEPEGSNDSVAEEELGLLDEEDEALAPDLTPEATAEASFTEGQWEEVSTDDIRFEHEGESERGDALSLAWLAPALRQNGLSVKAVEGWRARGRPYSFAPRGVVFHHTASPRGSGTAPSLGICVKGRSDLPGPLCHVLVARDGTVYLVAAGRANHAGYGGPWRSIPLNSANSYMAGVEVENDGLGEPWSKDLLRTCATVFATCLLHFGRTSSWLCGHKEWAPARKIDPSQVDMKEYRRRVALEVVRLSQHKPEAVPESEPPLELKPHAKPEQEYVVQAGDTLWRISQQHGVSVADLKQLNGLTTSLIHPGDKLKLRRAGR